MKTIATITFSGGSTGREKFDRFCRTFPNVDAPGSVILTADLDSSLIREVLTWLHANEIWSTRDVPGAESRYSIFLKREYSEDELSEFKLFTFEPEHNVDGYVSTEGAVILESRVTGRKVVADVRSDTVSGRRAADRKSG